jgi:hypothetical protein
MKLVHINFNIRLPFEYFKQLGSISGQTTDYISWELEHSYYGGELINFYFSYSAQEDHAGLSIIAGIFGYAIHFTVYDKRHWDYEKHTYIKDIK